MDDLVGRRAVEIGRYIAETKCTVRQAAKKFGISKSTVHKDISERLEELDDVQAVYSNENIASEVLDEIDAQG